MIVKKIIGYIILVVIGGFFVFETIYTNWIVLNGNEALATVIGGYEKINSGRGIGESYWLTVKFEIDERVYEEDLRVSMTTFESFKNNVGGNMIVFYNPNKIGDIRCVDSPRFEFLGFGLFMILSGGVCLFTEDNNS